MKGISAVIATILMLMITIAMAGLAYMYITGIFTQTTGVIIELDATSTSCSGETITVYVRNKGTLSTTLNLITLSGTTSAGGTLAFSPTTSCGGATALNAGAGSIACTSTGTGTAGTNTILASGPTQTARGTVYCTGL